MKIVVCAKQVPDTTEVKLDPKTGTLIRDGVPSIINPDDKAGIEAALQLKEKCPGSTVTVVSMGPPQADVALREALAMGCDEAILVSDRAFGGADTWATSSTIAAALKKLDYDVIITGRQAIDGDTAQVGPQIAEHLGLPQVSYAENVEVDGDCLKVQRQFEDRYHIIKVKMPCVITALAELAEPRYMTVAGIVDAYDSKEVKVWGLEDLKDTIDEANIGLKGSPTRVKQSFTKQPKAAGTVLKDLTPDEAVAAIVAEQRDGKIMKVSYELVGKARELADDLGQDVVAVLMGSGVEAVAGDLAKAGADKVIVVDDPMLAEYVTEPYAKAVTAVIKANDPEIVIFGASSIGRDLAPRVSARIHTGLTADCTKLEIDPETKLLNMTRPAFGGNIMATILCADFRPQMATVRPGVMQALESCDKVGTVEKFDVAFDAADMNVEICEVVKTNKKSVDITEAKILVSGGRGLGSAEGFGQLKDLADALGGEVSASRAAVDNGWIDKDRQVGQTGKTVRPDLYVACGISGAIQHAAGMEESEFIVAINREESAPIFGICDLGIVGDLNKIVPKLTEALKKN